MKRKGDGMSHERIEVRDFVDALRDCLGFAPLYRTDEPSNYLHEHPNSNEMVPGCRRIGSRWLS